MTSSQSRSSFKERCYQVLRQVPPGYVTTYKAIAEALGSKAYRAVGSAMATNPDAPATPCHRVVRTDGHLGGYAFGLDKKIALLEQEGVSLRGETVDLSKYEYSLKPL